MKNKFGQLREKHSARPRVSDRLVLWLSTKRVIDGLWVGTTEKEPYPGLKRVEEALSLIKRHSPIHYSRVLRNIERVWVRLTPHDGACYEHALKACVLDERFVLAETTSPEHIATTIVHEATHAQLEHWGIQYDEKLRPRIEAMCFRRELAFVKNLPNCAQVREELEHALEFYGSNSEYFSDANFSGRERQGAIEAFRHLGAPDWLAPTILMLRSVRFTVRDFASRLAGRVVLRFGTKDPNS